MGPAVMRGIRERLKRLELEYLIVCILEQVFPRAFEEYKFSRLKRYADLGIPDTDEFKLYTSRWQWERMKRILPELTERVKDGVSHTIRELDRRTGGVLEVGILKDFVDIEHVFQTKRYRKDEILIQATFQKRVERGEISREEALERLTRLLTFYALTPLDEIYDLEKSHVYYRLKKLHMPLFLYMPISLGLFAYLRDPDEDIYIEPQKAESSFLRLIPELIPLKEEEEEEKVRISSEDFKNAGKMLLTYPLIRSKLSPIKIRGTWLEDHPSVSGRDTISWDEFFGSPLNIQEAYLNYFNALCLFQPYSFFKEKVIPEVRSLLSQTLGVKFT